MISTADDNSTANVLAAASLKTEDSIQKWLADFSAITVHTITEAWREKMKLPEALNKQRMRLKSKPVRVFKNKNDWYLRKEECQEVGVA